MAKIKVSLSDSNAGIADGAYKLLCPLARDQLSLPLYGAQKVRDRLLAVEVTLKLLRFNVSDAKKRP
jgi:hypothetical protein